MEGILIEGKVMSGPEGSALAGGSPRGDTTFDIMEPDAELEAVATEVAEYGDWVEKVIR
jgi:hypothetical protein